MLGVGVFYIKTEVTVARDTVAIKSLITVGYSTIVYNSFHKKTEAEATPESRVLKCLENLDDGQDPPKKVDCDIEWIKSLLRSDKKDDTLLHLHGSGLKSLHCWQRQIALQYNWLLCSDKKDDTFLRFHGSGFKSLHCWQRQIELQYNSLLCSDKKDDTLLHLHGSGLKSFHCWQRQIALQYNSLSRCGGNGSYVNALRCYVVRTLPILFRVFFSSARNMLGEYQDCDMAASSKSVFPYRFTSKLALASKNNLGSSHPFSPKYGVRMIGILNLKCIFQNGF